MPSGQILYLMMFVGKCSCTSHVLQYSSSRSYEHSRSLQSSLCPGVVTVLICSFFVAALLLIYINLKNGGKIIHFFTICQTFLHFFAYSEELASIGKAARVCPRGSNARGFSICSQKELRHIFITFVGCKGNTFFENL